MRRFLFRLALALGKTYSELVSSLGTIDGIPEEYYWLAFHNLEPFGDDQRPIARLTALQYNSKRDSKKSKALTEDDFMPTRKETSDVEVSEEQAAAMMGIKHT